MNNWKTIEKGYLGSLLVEQKFIEKSSISINSCVNYKNNFKQMEPISGNINSEHDDNVESLTGNADGNDVGIEEILAANE